MLPLYIRAKLGSPLCCPSSVLCVFVVAGEFGERSRKKKKKKRRRRRSSVDSTSTPEGEVFVRPSLVE